MKKINNSEGNLCFPFNSFKQRAGIFLILLSVLLIEAVRLQAGQVTLNTGVVMDYNEIQVEGEKVILKIEGGQLKIKKDQLSEKDQKKYFASPEDEAVKPSEPVSPASGATLDQAGKDANQSSSVEKVGEAPLPAISQESTESVSVVTQDENSWPEGVPFLSYPEFGAIPESDLPAADVKLKVKTGDFKVKIEGCENMDVSVFYRIPMDGDKPAASANNLVFYCPYPTEKNKITLPHQLMVTDVLGCSMFAFCFDAKPEDLVDPKRCYWNPQSGWLKAALEAREKICKDFGLEKQKLIVMGQSAGSNMAETMACTYPNEVEAVAMIGGSEFIPLPEKSSIKWLVMNTRGDSTTTGNRDLAANLQKIGASVIYVAPAPIHKLREHENYNHVPGPQSWDLMNGFFWGIMKDRETLAAGKPARIWPYAAPIISKDKFKIVANTSVTALPGQVLLPSAAFADAWARVAPKVQKVTLPSSSGNGMKVLVGFPGRAAPKGVVLYYDALNYLNYGSSFENVASLAEMGYAVIAPADFGSKAPPPDQFLQASLSWISSQRVLSIRPLHLCGAGKPSLAFLNAASQDLAVNPASFGILQMEEADMQPDYRRSLGVLSKKCPFVAGFRVDKKDDEDIARMLDPILTKTAENRGSKKVELDTKNSVAKALGIELLAFQDMMEKVVTNP